MLNEVLQYAASRGLEQKPNRSLKKIKAYICIDSDGELEENAIEVPSATIEKYVPDIGTKEQGGKLSNATVCKIKYFLRDYKDKETPDDVLKSLSSRREGWRTLVDYLAEENNGFKAVSLFADKYAYQDDIEGIQVIVDKLVEKNIKKADSIVSFKIDGFPLEDDESWYPQFDKYMRDINGEKEAVKTISGLTGTVGTALTENTPAPAFKMVGLSPKYVTQLSNSSFSSYGQKTRADLPITVEDAETVKVAMNELLCGNKNYISDFQTLYWYENDNVPDIMTLCKSDVASIREEEDEDDDSGKPSEKDANDAFKKLYQSADKGLFLDELGNDDVGYVLFRLRDVGNGKGGRYHFSSKRQGKYGELKSGLMQWYDDTTLTSCWWDKNETTGKGVWRKNTVPVYQPIYALFALAPDSDTKFKDKEEDVKKAYGNHFFDLLQSVYFKNQIPEIIFRDAAYKCKTLIAADESFSKQASNLMRLIKCYLRRRGEQYSFLSNDVVANYRDASPEYRLGCLLAVLSDYHDKSLKTNKGYASSRIAMTSKTPKTALVTMLSEMSGILCNDNGGLNTAYSIGQVLEGLSASDFKDKTSVEDEAVILLGYFQQDCALKMRRQLSQEQVREPMVSKESIAHHCGIDFEETERWQVRAINPNRTLASSMLKFTLKNPRTGMDRVLNDLRPAYVKRCRSKDGKKPKTNNARRNVSYIPEKFSNNDMLDFLLGYYQAKGLTAYKNKTKSN